MKPSAHIAAVHELLSLYIAQREEHASVPADALIGQYFRKRRYIGSKDKAAIAPLCYEVIRYYASLAYLCDHYQFAVTPRSLVLCCLLWRHRADLATLETLHSADRYGTGVLSKQERAVVTPDAADHAEKLIQNAPEAIRWNVASWVMPMLHDHYGDDAQPLLAAMLKEAPIDIRVNTLKASREQVMHALQEEGMEHEPSPYSAIGIRMHQRSALFAQPSFQQGWFEVQDEGSQLIAALVAAKPGQRVIDFCAGAGGKTLAIAASMQNKGKILAWDTHAKRLADLPKRLKRAGVDNVEWRVIASEADQWIKRHKASADWVLVDAPCSGSGTWRRNPDLKWRSDEAALHRVMALQQRILASAARLVKTGGLLVYATCSLFDEENHQQVEHFLKDHPNFERQRVYLNALPDHAIDHHGAMRLNPAQHHTDGFYAAMLRRVS